MLFRNPKCFNTYKNNKKDITHTHTHTHTHTIRMQAFYTRWILQRQRTCDLYCDDSTAPRSPCQLLSFIRAEEFSCVAVLWVEEETVCTPNRLLTNTVCTSLQALCLLVWSLLVILHSCTQLSPSLRCHAVCMTARPDSLLRNTDTVRQTHHRHCWKVSFSGMTLNAILFSLTYLL